MSKAPIPYSFFCGQGWRACFIPVMAMEANTVTVAITMRQGHRGIQKPNQRRSEIRLEQICFYHAGLLQFCIGMR